MNDYAIVKDDKSLKRDMRNGSIVSTEEALNAYRKMKAGLLRERDKEREFATLKNEVEGLKNLVKELVTQLSKTL